eukprot:GHVU01059866.1.p2 GENE.GHVU01059866.1~~GHVU01059866.1.p2  ORF type:complete len:104 (+),score=6.15 GHVU01059866.1:597-908(+)
MEQPLLGLSSTLVNSTKSGKFPGFTEPAKGCHGVKFSETFGAAAFAVKVRTEFLRDIGPCMNPFSAFLLLQGLETLTNHMNWPKNFFNLAFMEAYFPSASRVI